ncbi:hypothetical protein [Oceanobacillus halotolerans]|uniref:hypothetical protein n=1 Tax=Oceanobacillus halotolerans TaxID=2663380 RepID=UPI0013DCD8AB|nr:hypothetical protein [Oceanobacillus halotolerans]
MSKTETQALFQIISEFINDLSKEQMENLVNGNATIAYRSNSQPIGYQHLETSIRNSKSIQEVERACRGMVKKEIIAFCEVYDIALNKRDTKKVLFKKIASHFQIENTESVQEKDESELEKIKETFQQLKSVEEAKQFLTNHPLLITKKDLIRFAKILDVYVNPKQKKAIILNRIIESVIGSKVRAKVIQES